MNNTIIEDYALVHDNEILSYLVEIGSRLQLFTNYQDEEKTTITFEGLDGHYFKNVTYSNIIGAIRQVSIDFFINCYRDFLSESIIHAFPICATNLNALCEYLNKKDLKVFEIDAVLGLSGFVIAKEIIIETEYVI
jgi:hypothetical protein